MARRRWWSASAGEPFERFASDFRRQGVLTIELAQLYREILSAEVPRDAPARGIDRQNVISRAVREKKSRGAVRFDRNDESGREGHDVREEIAVCAAKRDRVGRTI